MARFRQYMLICKNLKTSGFKQHQYTSEKPFNIKKNEGFQILKKTAL